MESAKSVKALHSALKESWRIRLLTIEIWLIVSFLSISYGETQDSASTIMTYTTLENQTPTVNMNHSQATVTVGNYSVSISSTQRLLPSNCHRVCVCNSSEEQNMTRSFTMTTMPNITTSSPLSMSSDVMVSHTPSSVRMSYTTVAPMSYNSSVWPTLAASVSRPFVCTGESCTQEVECLTDSSLLSATPYDVTATPQSDVLVSGSATDSRIASTTSYDFDATTAVNSPTVSTSSVALSIDAPCSGSLDCYDSTLLTTTSYVIMTSNLPTASSSLAESTPELLCSGSRSCHDSTALTTTFYDVITSISPTASESLARSTTELLCSGSPGCHDTTLITSTYDDVTTSILSTVQASSPITTIKSSCLGSLGCHASSLTLTSSAISTPSLLPTTTSSLAATSTVISCSGLLNCEASSLGSTISAESTPLILSTTISSFVKTSTMVSCLGSLDCEGSMTLADSTLLPLSTITSSSAATSTVISCLGSLDCDGKTPNDYTPAIVGIVMGCLAGIMAVLVIVGILWWRHQKTLSAELPM